MQETGKKLAAFKRERFFIMGLLCFSLTCLLVIIMVMYSPFYMANKLGLDIANITFRSIKFSLDIYIILVFNHAFRFMV
jgi:hypothetical protein